MAKYIMTTNRDNWSLKQFYTIKKLLSLIYA